MSNIINYPDITNAKIGVIYVYYTRKNETKNQTNLSFFLKYALNKKLWLPLDIKYLFVNNGTFSECIFPTDDDIYFINNDSDSDWEGWAKGMLYFEKLFNKNIWDIFDYICFINCSVIGPIMENDTGTHWIIPAYKQLINDNAILCCPSLSFMTKNDPAGDGPRAVPTFSLLRITKEISDLIRYTEIDLVDETFVHKYEESTDKRKNVVFGKKYDKNDAVMSGEYGFSRILLQNNYKITSLLYYGLDILNKKNWSINNFCAPDRFNNYFLPTDKSLRSNIPLSTIFIKNVWRAGTWYASYPVRYSECCDFVYGKLNMSPIVYDPQKVPLDFEKLDPKVVYFGDCNDIKNGSAGIPKSKKYLYENFLYAEEAVIFSKSKKQNCVVYVHNDTNIIKDYVIQSLQALCYADYDILFYTLCEQIDNVDESILPFNVIKVKNKTNIEIFGNALLFIKKEMKKYDWICLIDDSVVLPINGLDTFLESISNIRKKCDIWSHWEIYNDDMCFWPIMEFKSALLDNMINILDLNKSYLEMIENILTNNFKYEFIVKNKDISYNYFKEGVFNVYIMSQWLFNDSTFAFRLKDKYTKETILFPRELNYLLRYL